MKKSNLVRTTILAGSLLLQLSRLCFQTRGAAGDLDLSFDPGSGINGAVRAVALQPDGKLIIGGHFTTVGGLTRTGVARLNADGSGDSSFDAGTNISGDVTSIALQQDGKALVASGFYAFGRLNTDGSRDTGFNAALTPYDSVTSFALQSDGRIVIAGSTVHFGCEPPDSPWYPNCYFSHYSYFVARLHANGTRDFTLDAGAGPDDVVRAITLQPDGKVLIGGDFLNVNGTNRNRIARLNVNGTLDNGFDPGTGANGIVQSVVPHVNGKILIGGYFTIVNDTYRNGIARLNADGSLDGGFSPGLVWDNHPYPVLHSMLMQSDGKVLIGGAFTTVNATNRSNIARLNANGSLDSTFNPGTGTDGGVSSVALQADRKVLIGGGFLTVNGVLRQYLARLHGDSVVVPPLNIRRSNVLVIVSWPVTGFNIQLQESTNLSLPNSWSPVGQSDVTNAGQISVTVPMTVGRKFFRLKSQ